MDLEYLKSQFPIFSHYPEWVYLDSAATTQKPMSVIDVHRSFYEMGNANIHRGVYDLSNKATDAFEEVRAKGRDFLHAPSDKCIAFTKGTTEGINIVAHSFLSPRLQSGQNIVCTQMEHHANLIPWQYLSKKQGVELRLASVCQDATLNLDHLDHLLDEKTALLALTHISNTSGVINPIKEIIELAHQRNIPILIDAAQSAAFYPIAHKELDYDFLVFSGHKIFGPMGTGILFVHPKWHAHMKPYNLGGGIVKEVSNFQSSFQDYPHVLDAGTPDVAGIVALGKALDFLSELDQAKILNHLQTLTQSGLKALSNIAEANLVGPTVDRSSILTFQIQGIHPHDVASFLNQDQIAVRAGMHCTQPLLETLGYQSTVRASLSLYNNQKDIDKFIQSIKDIIAFWS